MRIIKLGRGQGKTYQLITKAAERNAYIVCRDRKEAERIFQAAIARGLDINFPITFQEFINKRHYGRGTKEFMIDDVDMLLECLSNGSVSYCTYTPK